MLGVRARAVFAASSRVAHEPGGRHADVVLADTPAEAAGIEAPAVILCEAPALAAPALDPALDNPVGWVREVEPRVAALGPGQRRHCDPQPGRIASARRRQSVGRISAA